MQRYPLKYRVLLKWEYLIILDENGNNGNCIVISNKIHPNFLHIYYYFKKAFKFWFVIKVALSNTNSKVI